MVIWCKADDLAVDHTGDAEAIKKAIKFSTAASAGRHVFFFHVNPDSLVLNQFLYIATHPVCQPRANLNHGTDEEQSEG